MSDLMEMTWNNPMGVTWVNLMGKSLWVENECPYRFDLIDLSEKVPMFSWMNVPIKVTWVNLMGISLWSSESVPIKVTWCEWKWVSLSKWMESMRNEWIEVNRVNRGEMKDLKDLTLWTLWESPYGRKRVSLSKWLDLFVVTKSFQNEWNRWDLNELKWIEWNEVKWVIWRNWLRTTLWERSYGQ